MVLGSAISKAATQTRVHEINQASLKSEQSILTSYCFWQKKERKEKKRIFIAKEQSEPDEEMEQRDG